MKGFMKSYAKIQVVSCEERFEKDSKHQAMDSDGNKLWDIHVKEKKFNEKFGEEEVNLLKQVNIGETKGTFTAVNSFFTILEAIEPTATFKDAFSLSGVIPPSKRPKKGIEANAA